jgi:hypothetical protein
MNNDVHWIVPTLVGVLLGAALPYVLKLVLYFVRRFQPFFLEGEWYSYYFIYENSTPVLKQEKWIVSKGILHRIAITALPITPTPNTFPRKYQGKLVKEQNLFTVNLKPNTHTENILVRFKGTYNYDQNVLLGLWSGIDLDGYACVGPQIISRSELTDKEIKNTASKVHVEEDKRLMKIS